MLRSWTLIHELVLDLYKAHSVFLSAPLLSVGENKVKTNMIKVIELADGMQSLESRNQSALETKVF